MCTYNGAKFLVEQLNSINNQTVHNIDLWVSDDGSQDETLAILKRYKKKWTKGTFEIVHGPQNGFAYNFLSLVCNPSIKADYFAYSDQDDVWLPEKLHNALDSFEPHNSKASLYCSRTTLIDKDGKLLNRLSPNHPKEPSFSNALVQSLAGGNTMVFNNQARTLLLNAGLHEIISHDWWTYLLVAGNGGNIYYDPTPLILYRQHEHNLIGSTSNIFTKFNRVVRIMTGQFTVWNNRHIELLYLSINSLTKANKVILEKFSSARNHSLTSRIKLLYKSGVYRQTTEGSIALWIAAILNKI